MLCKCGCGKDAGLYKSSFSAVGIVAGEPKIYLKGHFRKGKRTLKCSKGHVRTAANTNAGGKCRGVLTLTAKEATISTKKRTTRNTETITVKYEEKYWSTTDIVVPVVENIGKSS